MSFLPVFLAAVAHAQTQVGPETVSLPTQWVATAAVAVFTFLGGGALGRGAGGSKGPQDVAEAVRAALEEQRQTSTIENRLSDIEEEIRAARRERATILAMLEQTVAPALASLRSRHDAP